MRLYGLSMTLSSIKKQNKGKFCAKGIMQQLYNPPAQMKREEKVPKEETLMHIKEFFQKFLDKYLWICYNVNCSFQKNGPLAQLAEHLTFNQGVRSSNLRWLIK